MMWVGAGINVGVSVHTRSSGKGKSDKVCVCACVRKIKHIKINTYDAKSNCRVNDEHHVAIE